jgi:hypothetical protein
MPIDYVNPDGTVERGNPNVENSDNINVDLKFEMFPNAKELIAVGIFGNRLKIRLSVCLFQRRVAVDKSPPIKIQNQPYYTAQN